MEISLQEKLLYRDFVSVERLFYCSSWWNRRWFDKLLQASGKRNIVSPKIKRAIAITGWGLRQRARWTWGCLRHRRLRGGLEEDSSVHETGRRPLQGFLQIRLRRLSRSTAQSAEREFQYTSGANWRTHTQWVPLYGHLFTVSLLFFTSEQFSIQ